VCSSTTPDETSVYWELSTKVNYKPFEGSDRNQIRRGSQLHGLSSRDSYGTVPNKASRKCQHVGRCDDDLPMKPIVLGVLALMLDMLRKWSGE